MVTTATLLSLEWAHAEAVADLAEATRLYCAAVCGSGDYYPAHSRWVRARLEHQAAAARLARARGERLRCV